MRFAFSLFGHELFAIDLTRAIHLNLTGADDADDEGGEPKGIGAGTGGQFEVPFGFRPPEWFPGEFGQDPHHTSG